MNEYQWDSDVDPLEDARKAIAKMKEPTPESYYRRIDKIEQDVQKAIGLLVEMGKTPEEIEAELIKHGIW
jgi:hypothetical protein